MYHYKYCILLQICIKKEYRGRYGLVENLYNELKKKLRGDYDLAISEIGAHNKRSLNVHINKIGFKVIKKYLADGVEWFIVALDI